MEAASNKIVHRDGITDDAFTSDSGDIPEKYIRTNEHRASAVVGEDEPHELPVVDMARLLDPESSASETSKLGSACRDWGFFQARTTAPAVTCRIFQSPDDDSFNLFALVSAAAHKPWSRRGCDAADEGQHRAVLRLATRRQERRGGPRRRLRGLRPPLQQAVEAGLGGERDTHHPAGPGQEHGALANKSTNVPGCTRGRGVLGASAAVTKLVARLLGAMAADRGVGREALVGAFAGKRQSVAIHHYPPCRHPGKVIGNTAHTDGLALAVLLHADDTPGLQVLRGGRWFPVRPPPGGAGLVVNVGDILHILTNGAYRSVEHRVVADAARRGRTTAVVFQDASVGGLVAPLPDLLRGGAAEAARYKSIPRLEYLKVRFSALAKRTGFLESLKL